METLIRNKILHHIQQIKLICQEQRGFTHGRSCVTQLLETLDYGTESLDKSISIDAIYTDFHKAFDYVYNRRLLHQTNCHGFK